MQYQHHLKKMNTVLDLRMFTYTRTRIVIWEYYWLLTTIVAHICSCIKYVHDIYMHTIIWVDSGFSMKWYLYCLWVCIRAHVLVWLKVFCFWQTKVSLFLSLSLLVQIYSDWHFKCSNVIITIMNLLLILIYRYVMCKYIML